MKITKKQKEEVEFLSRWGKILPSEGEISSYISGTVHGLSRTSDKSRGEPLRNAKQSFSVIYAMWKEDIEKKLLSKEELIQDFQDYPYALRLIERL